jgi:exonuclease VII large subunit
MFKKSKLLAVLTTLFIMGNAQANEIEIKASDALNYLGKTAKVCGSLAAIKDFKSGIYLSIDKPYPNESITFVVWDDNINKITKEWGSFRGLRGKTVCAEGKVETYKNKARISINSGYDFYVK